MRNLARSGRDHRSMTGHRHADEDRAAEALFTGHGQAAPSPLLAFVGDLRDLGRGASPAPSPALARLLHDGLVVSAPTAPAPPLRAGRRRGLRGALLAVIAVGSVTAAATAATAADALPSGAQRVTASFLNAVTPFHFPTPLPTRPAHPRPLVPPAGSVPGPTSSAAAATDASARPSPAHRGAVSPSGDAPNETGPTTGGSGETENSTGSRIGTGTGADGRGSDDAPASAAPQPAASAPSASSPAQSPEAEPPPATPETTAASGPAGGGDPAAGTQTEGVG
ncbi:MAG: hypothetical protein NVSMB55_25690 [Mycobacteriales bacterium]